MSELHAVDVRFRILVGSIMTEPTLTFASDDDVPLTITDLVSLGNGLISDLIPLLTPIFADNVWFDSMHLQARGTTVPTWELPISELGTRTPVSGNQLPAEFCYGIRWYVGTTYKSISGEADTDHPINRGYVFLSGADESYHAGGLFVVPSGDVSLWTAFFDYMADSHLYGVHNFVGAVLGEQIESGTGWRIANIVGGNLKRITSLRSRRQ